MTHLEIILAVAVFALLIAAVKIFMRLGRLDKDLHDLHMRFIRDSVSRTELNWANKRIEAQEKQVGLMADHLHIQFKDIPAHTCVEVRK